MHRGQTRTDHTLVLQDRCLLCEAQSQAPASQGWCAISALRRRPETPFAIEHQTYIQMGGKNGMSCGLA